MMSLINQPMNLYCYDSSKKTEYILQMFGRTIENLILMATLLITITTQLNVPSMQIPYIQMAALQIPNMELGSMQMPSFEMPNILLPNL